MAYVDKAVPFGSHVFSVLRLGTAIGDYIFESISITRPSKIIERPNQIGEPNGWVGVLGFAHGTCVIQIATVDTPYPTLGDYLETGVFNSAGTTERWVIVDGTQPYAMADYYKSNATIRLSTNPPA